MRGPLIPYSILMTYYPCIESESDVCLFVCLFVCFGCKHNPPHMISTLIAVKIYRSGGDSLDGPVRLLV